MPRSHASVPHVPATESGGEAVPHGIMAAVWFALVAISVVGRLWQPVYHVTPLAGAAIAAGVAFPNPLVAASVPMSALAISNLVLPGYGDGLSAFVMSVVVYAAISWPVLLGAGLRRSNRGPIGRGIAVLGSGLASSLVFFFVTNFAHWYLGDDYPHTGAGLLACFAAGLPFYRWAPVGDMVWTVALLGGLAAFGCRMPYARPISTHPANAA